MRHTPITDGAGAQVLKQMVRRGCQAQKSSVIFCHFPMLMGGPWHFHHKMGVDVVMHGTVVESAVSTVDGVMVELDINGSVVPVHTDKLSRRLS